MLIHRNRLDFSRKTQIRTSRAVKASRRHTFRDRYDGLTERYAELERYGSAAPRQAHYENRDFERTRCTRLRDLMHPVGPCRPMTFDQISQCLTPRVCMPDLLPVLGILDANE